MANQTNLQIKSTYNNKTRTTNVNYVNGSLSNATLIEFAQKLIALTTDTYSSTTKITKEELA